jgi:rod shape-determining protein MreD
MAKSAIGYVAASIGLQVDVESPLTRIVITFTFSIINSVLLFLIDHRLLGLPDYHLFWGHELIRACANTIIAIPIFFLLDYTKRTD